MTYNVAVAKGDGVGPEVVDAALHVLERISQVFGINIEYKEVLVGGDAYDKVGSPLPKETLDVIVNSHAVLFGAVGGEKWDSLPADKRPEMAILGLRKALDTYCNLRPAVLYNELKDASPLKNSILENGFDICVVRELAGGIYFGKKRTWEENGIQIAEDVEQYSETEVERIARKAFEIAASRKMKVTSVDKANVLETSRLWRNTVQRIHSEYPDIELEHMYIDNAAMQVIRNPCQFDVILTSNIFGDILSDEISMLTGSIGLLPSASIGNDKKGIYEPIHGSAPDIAGQDIANPIGTILSAAMMLEISFDNKEAADSIRDAVGKTLNQGQSTKDIFIKEGKTVGTKEVGRLIASNIEKNAGFIE